VKATFPTLSADGIMAGVVVRFCEDVSRTGRMGSMTDRSNERERRARRQTEEDHKRQQEDKEKRSDQLKESWRRNHPSEEEEKRPKRGRPA
jgi:hypothetical protein